MTLSRKDILDAHGELKNRRALEEPEWREIAALIHPEQRDIGTRGKTTRVHDYIYDSTPIYAKEQFVGGLFSQSTNPADRWFEFGLADKDLQAWGPAKEWLANFTNLGFASFAPAVSAFYAMVPASYADLGVFGLGCFYSDIDQRRGRFNDLHIPLSESFAEFDAAGFPMRFHREFVWRGERLKREFGEAAAVFDDRREYAIAHAVYPNPSFRPGALGPRGQAWSSCYVCADAAENFRVEKGYYEMPYTATPWNMRSGRYPTGPGHLSRPDVAMLNDMERVHIVAAELDADPILLANDDSVVTAADIEPGRVLNATINEQGKQLLQRFDRGSQIQLSMAQSEQRRAAIREAFLFSIMQLVNRPQMTATEFLGFKEEQLRLMGPNLGRIHTYGLAPLIARRARLLQRAGMVPPPPRELAGQNIEVTFTSPLARAQKVAQARTILQFTGQVIQMATAAGRPDMLDKVDFDKSVDKLGEGLGVEAGIVRADDAVAELRAARAQAQQQQVAVEQAAQLSSVYADVAHANQAQTRSAQRQERAS